MKKVVKGFTLVELAVAISVSTVVVGMAVFVLIFGINSYNSSQQESNGLRSALALKIDVRDFIASCENKKVNVDEEKDYLFTIDFKEVYYSSDENSLYYLTKVNEEETKVNIGNYTSKLVIKSEKVVTSETSQLKLEVSYSSKDNPMEFFYYVG